MSMTPTITLNLASCTLDDQCKATLKKMLSHGWNKADTPYTTTQQVLSPAELNHLLTRGGLGFQPYPIGALKSFVFPKFGAGFGVEIGFKLNVDLK